MIVHGIRGHLDEPCGIEVPPDLVAAVADAVPEDVAEPSARRLPRARSTGLHGPAGGTVPFHSSI